MKPPIFDYAAPTTVAETLSLLADSTAPPTLFAGGQSLVPALNFRLGAPALLVDINRVEGLAGINVAPTGIRIGAMTRHRDVIASDVVARAVPMLAAAAKHIGHVPIRNRGTVGGSVAHADPAAEIPAVAVVLDGVVELVSTRGTRDVSVEDFVLGPYFTAREPDELVTALRLQPAGTGAWGFHEIVRSAGDFALAGAVAIVEVSAGAVASARLGLFGVEAAPRRLREAEDALRGVEAAMAANAAVTAIRSNGIDAVDDPQVPADYRAHLAAVAVGRAVAEAIERGAR
jgi:CO/xanthine dehydrogenase FAD-binding subunit